MYQILTFAIANEEMQAVFMFSIQRIDVNLPFDEEAQQENWRILLTEKQMQHSLTTAGHGIYFETGFNEKTTAIDQQIA